MSNLDVAIRYDFASSCIEKHLDNPRFLDRHYVRCYTQIAKPDYSNLQECVERANSTFGRQSKQ